MLGLKLLDVLTELLKVSADWYNIGLALNMSSGTLDAMEGPYKRPRDCLRDMLKEWLSTSPDPSWEGLIAALRHPVVGKETLARQLEAKHCTQAPPEGRYRVLPGKRPWALQFSGENWGVGTYVSYRALTKEHLCDKSLPD